MAGVKREIQPIVMRERLRKNQRASMVTSVFQHYRTKFTNIAEVEALTPDELQKKFDDIPISLDPIATIFGFLE